MGFNPLNQVYVFNKTTDEQKAEEDNQRRFNPLNQVYVFNKEDTKNVYSIQWSVLIP